jgi:prevent-host-death family protein
MVCSSYREAVIFAVVFYSSLGYTISKKELIDMPNIKPISDLRNYSEVLNDVAVGAPVFLTRNGRGKYAIVDMHDYEKTQATLRLMNELAKGRKSGEEKGWLTLEAVEEHLGIVNE